MLATKAQQAVQQNNWRIANGGSLLADRGYAYHEAAPGLSLHDRLLGAHRPQFQLRILWLGGWWPERGLVIDMDSVFHPIECLFTLAKTKRNQQASTQAKRMFREGRFASLVLKVSAKQSERQRNG